MKDINKQPGINFDSIILKDTTFNREPEVNPPLDANLNIEAERGLNENKSEGQLKLTVSLTADNPEKKSVLKLKASFIGFFSVQSENKNMDLEKFMFNNAPGIMFPYIREHISTITQKAGIEPLILPPINIYALLKENE